MTFDLAVWLSHPRLSATSASRIYNDLCKGQGSGDLLPAQTGIEDFFAELTVTWPVPHRPASKLRPDPDSPWAVPPLRSQNYVLLSSHWEHAPIVLAFVLGLAGKHGLSVYDPQSEELYPPETASTSTTV